MSPPSRSRVFVLTALTLFAFASNSILCRMALGRSTIDALSFTTIRLASGAVALALIAPRSLTSWTGGARGSWSSGIALWAYAIAFSLAYIGLDAGTGALVALSGIAWGIYSLRGRGVHDPTAATAGNFLRAAPIMILAGLPWSGRASVSPEGVFLATVSGAFMSGVGYVVWYAALRGHTATSAGIVQLAVPVLASVGGVLLLAEHPTMRLGLAGTATLGGVALAVVSRKR